MTSWVLAADVREQLIVARWGARIGASVGLVSVALLAEFIARNAGWMVAAAGGGPEDLLTLGFLIAPLRELWVFVPLALGGAELLGKGPGLLLRWGLIGWWAQDLLTRWIVLYQKSASIGDAFLQQFFDPGSGWI
jgi:hypothetical protein